MQAPPPELSTPTRTVRQHCALRQAGAAVRQGGAAVMP
eukprot:CAMPEP_0172896486 /NCGR_PEP_ID=MMETSP1075-20121228/155620_1 /TAXON_ID=2916 /ORGANISM="Ceratium fusus, Strain PA161109" /LENGTH=37 /DNA_ID= /DNA_START= /DNA_END= /DNA_ORIENTATION=